MSNGGGGGGGDYLQHRVEEDVASEEEMMPESASMGMAGGSDEMLMSLLASQAAVDCETLPIGGWEEVESWKKVCSAPSIPVARYLLIYPCRSSHFCRTDYPHLLRDIRGKSRSLLRRGHCRS